jgi:Gpi18-like mannosyltransferase
MAAPILKPARFGISRETWKLIGLWLVVRLSTLPFAAFASQLRPVTDLEESLPVWPPGSPLGVWLYRVFLSPWQRWDAEYYVSIAANGYQPGSASAQFHPLFPILASPLARLLGQPMLALLCVSSLASLALLLAFERLARADLDEETARRSTLLLLLSPLSYSLFVPYTEALFLLLSVLCLYSAQRGRWVYAGAFGSLATLTRPQGLFLVLPLAWETWEAADRNWRNLLRRPARLAAAVALIPGAMFVWVAYRAWFLSDFRLDFGSPKAFLVSLLLSPSAPKVVHTQTFLWPWQAVSTALSIVAATWDVDTLLDLILAAAFLVLAAFSLSRIRLSQRIYVVTIVLVSLGYYTGPVHPYMGLPRHLFLAFPVFIGMGSLLARSGIYLLITGLGFLGMFFLLALYVVNGWVP